MEDDRSRVPELRNFCEKCGALLSVATGSGAVATCRLCGHPTPLVELTASSGTITTSLTIKQSEVLRRLYSRNVKAMGAAEEAVVDEDCPVCKHPKLSYRTAQLRGLDEGQTVFYTCLNPDCLHKFTVNS